jgi:rSAM/selenodomain-associated transferase 2
MSATGSISVIVPALNEAERIVGTVESARAAHELIVVDGASTDDTAAIARARGATVIPGPPGRARQMNLGAEHATGDTLLFLHADTCLPTGFDRHVHEVLAMPGVVAGAFPLYIGAPVWQLRWIERAIAWRSRLLQLPYGDQALFLPADTFRAIGGYRDIPLMEDVALVRALRARGRIGIAPVPVATSDRRWRRLGILRTTLLNLGLLAAYHAGVPPRHLARWYGAGHTATGAR